MEDKAEAEKTTRSGEGLFWERKCAKSEEEMGEREGGDAKYSSI